MKLRKRLLQFSVLMLVSVMPAFAQVEKVAMRTTGISCGVCAAVSEINFKRLGTVDKVTISRSNEAIMISYKPGAVFRPQEFRDLLKPLEVGIAQFQISAKGRLQEQGGRRFFLAGKDKFLLVPSAPQVPANATVLVEGIVDDHTYPMELKVMTVKPVQQ